VLLIAAAIAISGVSAAGTMTLYEDDFGPALKVREWIETGRFSIHGFPLNPQIFQILWGALFCVLFGYSLPVLNYSTLILSLLGITFLYLSLAEISGSRRRAVFLAVCFLLFPATVLHSSTFMTEIPFATLITLSIYCLIRYGRSGSTLLLLLASFFIGAACMTRHHAIFIAGGFALAEFLRPGNIRQKFYRAFLLLLFPALLTLSFMAFVWHTQPRGYATLLKLSGLLPASPDEITQMQSVLQFFRERYAPWSGTGYKLFAIVISPFFGLIIPLLALFASSPLSQIREMAIANFRIVSRVIAVVILLAIVALAAQYPELLFESMGPRRSFFPALTYNSRPVFYALTAVAAAGVVFLASCFFLRKFSELPAAVKACLFALLLYAVAHLPWPVFYTNYILPSIFPLILVIAAELTKDVRINYARASIILALAAFFSMNFVRHQTRVDALLWQKGRQYAGQSDLNHVLVGSLPWMGFHHFPRIERSLGYASTNVSLWDDVLHSAPPPPQFVISRADIYGSFDNAYYISSGAPSPLPFSTPNTAAQKKYTTRQVRETIDIVSPFLKDSIIIIQKE